jgi:SAM-dependent methyltransferase
MGVMEYVDDLKSAVEEICRTLKAGGYVVLSISSLHIFNFLRNLIGHRIFIRNPEILKQLLKEMNLEIIREAHTRLQNQYLLKKAIKFETYN